MSQLTRLDITDLRIMKLLSRDSRTPYRNIASAVGIMPSAAKERINKMVSNGAIRCFVLFVNPVILGYEKECILTGTRVPISDTEVADRLEIRELLDSYAHCADKRDAKGQMSPFTNDAHFVVFMDAKSNKPSSELNRREDLDPIFNELNKYEVTTHFKG